MKYSKVMEFQFLKTDVHRECNTYKEIRKQTMKGTPISEYLRGDITWKNKYLSFESKIKIYKTIVRPFLTYAPETRAESSKTKQLCTTEKYTLGSIKGKTKRDRVRNSETSRRFRRSVKNDNLKWYGGKIY